MEITADTTPQQIRYTHTGHGRLASVIEVHYNGLSLEGRNQWVPENWNGSLLFSRDEGDSRLVDTREDAEAGLAAAQARYNGASGETQAYMDGRRD
jgi:hypothetical protein